MGGLIGKAKEEEKNEPEDEIDPAKSTLENLEALGYIIHKESPEDYGKLRQKADPT
jgi:hypothetical protein